MNVFIVEDQRMFADALCVACKQELDCTVVGFATDGKRAVADIVRLRPDLVLLDLDLPVLDGFQVMERVRQSAPAVKFLIVSSYCDDRTVFQVERSGAVGYLDKDGNTLDTLRRALDKIRSGGRFHSKRFLAVRAARFANPRSFDKVLSRRQQTILACIGEGWRDSRIAEHLGISEETAEKHRFNIRRRLGIPSLQDLAEYARKLGFRRKTRTDSKSE